MYGLRCRFDKLKRTVFTLVVCVYIVFFIFNYFTLVRKQDDTPIDSLVLETHSNLMTLKIHEMTTVSSEIRLLRNLPVPEAFSVQHFYGFGDLLKFKNYFKPRSVKVSPLNYAFLEHTSAPCTTNKIYSFVVLVLSQHHMKSQRQAIRDTWGSVSINGSWPGLTQKFPTKLVFIIGVSKNESLNAAVAKEAKEKGDLVLIDLDDTYFNLTRKVLMGFKWVKEFCSQTKYVMKVDEDTYVNLPKLVKYLEKNNLNNKICGPFFYFDAVKRDGKFSVSTESYPAKVYPPHVKGNIYIITIDIVLKLLLLSEYMPYVNVEDVYITGILAKPYNIRHTALRGYKRFHTAKPCSLVTGSFTASQQIFVKTFYEIWEKVKEDSLCE